MKILAIEKGMPGLGPDEFTQHLKSEAMRVWSLYQSGIVRELYFRQDRSEAILILECVDMEEARTALSSLPLVESGLIDFELIPLIPYSGFSRLFTQ